ncbi:MAG: tetratricopeptide repeat protein [Candidatus Melainabacteria bacterium]|nr:tetratricopeptide repeat protein [Candidatus Melainabacteria bacterium]
MCFKKLTCLITFLLFSLLSECFLSHAYSWSFFYTTPEKSPKETFVTFYYTLGIQLAARGQILSAETFLKRCTELQPNKAEIHLSYASVLEALDRLELAEQSYKMAIALDPSLVAAHYNLGLLYDKLDRLDEGILALKSALLHAENNQLLNYDLGVLYSKKLDYQNAALYTKRAIDSGQPFAESYNNYAYALAHLGQLDQAMIAVERSLLLQPESAASIDTKGFILYKMKRYAEAVEVYRKAIQLDPTIGEIHLHWAQVHQALDQPEQALAGYENYLRLTPDAPDHQAVRELIKELKTKMDAPLQTAPASLQTPKPTSNSQIKPALRTPYTLLGEPSPSLQGT